MNKVVALMLLLCALACGEHEEYESEVGMMDHEGMPSAFASGEEIVYGTSKQPIYMPLEYGSESSTSSPRCIPPWGGGECQVPDSRTMSVRVMNTPSGDSNCGTAGNPASGTGKAVNDAVNDAIAIANSKGWLMTRKADNSLTGQITVRCTGSSSGNPATTTGANYDCHDTEHGDLCQFGTANIEVRMGVIFAMPGYQQATAAQRQNVIYNILKHELGHALGFGHNTFGMASVMFSPMPSAPVANVTDPWDGYRAFAKDELHMLDCYRDSSGTTPDCPNP